MAPAPALGSGTTNRVRYAAAAIFMQVLLGVIYAWSVFRAPLAQLHGWTKAQTIAPYRYSLLVFAAGMIIAGFWQDRKGPRVVATVGGILIAVGCVMASLLGSSIEGLVLSYGVVVGLGVGFAYVTPIAMCIKWFPDKRGMIVGLAGDGVRGGATGVRAAAGDADREEPGGVRGDGAEDVPGAGGDLPGGCGGLGAVLPRAAGGVGSGGLGEEGRLGGERGS